MCPRLTAPQHDHCGRNGNDTKIHKELQITTDDEAQKRTIKKAPRHNNDCEMQEEWQKSLRNARPPLADDHVFASETQMPVAIPIIETVKQKEHMKWMAKNN